MSGFPSREPAGIPGSPLGDPGDSILPLEDHLLPESRNPHSESIDAMSPREVVRLMNAEDAKVSRRSAPRRSRSHARSSGPRTGFVAGAG